MHINIILYIASIPTCFNASTSYSGGLNLVLAKVTKLLRLLKLQLSKSSRLQCVT